MTPLDNATPAPSRGPRLTAKQVTTAIAKLHLERGDALIVDARVFDAQHFMMSTGAPRDCRIFPVIPEPGSSIHDSFLILHAAEIDHLTHTQLLRVARAFALTDEHWISIIDGIEADFCKCMKMSDGERYVDGPCSIHERCSALRARLTATTPTQPALAAAAAPTEIPDATS